MGRIRTIKPEFWHNESMAAVSEPACLLAIGLLNYVDDEGYFNANENLIMAAVFPIREPSVTLHGLISELVDIGYIELGAGKNKRRYGRVLNFKEHQVINRAKDSKIKDLVLKWDSSVMDHGAITDASVQEQGREQGREDSVASDEATKKDEYSKEFLEFWLAYPRRKTTPKIIGKLKCSKKCELIINKKQASWKDFVEGAKKYARSDTVKKDYVQLPETWLNNTAWIEDDVNDISAVQDALIYQYDGMPADLFSEWEALSKKLITVIGVPAYNSWFKKVEYHGQKDGIAQLVAPTNMVKEKIKNDFKIKFVAATGLEAGFVK